MAFPFFCFLYIFIYIYIATELIDGITCTAGSEVTAMETHPLSFRVESNKEGGGEEEEEEEEICVDSVQYFGDRLRGVTLSS